MIARTTSTKMKAVAAKPVQGNAEQSAKTIGSRTDAAPTNSNTKRRAKAAAQKSDASSQTGAPTVVAKTVGASRKTTAHAPASETIPSVAGSDGKAISQRHGFKLNETVVYSKLGVGKIIGISEKHVIGETIEMFVIKRADGKLTVMLPTTRALALGLRKLSSPEAIAQALGTLSGRTRAKRMMWARRAQEYEMKIKSGDLITIAEVARDLYRPDMQPEGSYSERQLYEAALGRLAPEIAAVKGLALIEARKLIETHLQMGPGRGVSAVVKNADNDDIDDAA